MALAVMRELPFDPTEEQLLLVVALAHFLLYAPERGVFLLTGYAGTGKTSVVGALVRALRGAQRPCVLLAPTGRAAHILADYSSHAAFTIHRKIYRQHSYGSDTFMLAENKLQNTLFIVDEASMIANATADGGAAFGSGRLLDDLVAYVYNGLGCRLLLMGDPAQLPPVGSAESPALSEKVLQGYGLAVYSMTLRQIARQASESGILANATALRQVMEEGTLVTPVLNVAEYPDIQAVSGEFLMEVLDDCYGRDGLEQTIVVTRSNRRATLFNTGIRNRILYREEELTGGDILVVAKNNYLWAEEYPELDFIANGDVLRVRRVRGDVERAYGLRFATVTVELPDHGGLEMDVKVVLDCLLGDTPALTQAQSECLFNEVWNELTGDRRERYRQLKQHPYFNALQVKYAYAVTCHKAQGGQWANVLVDMGGIAAEATTTLDYHRWLYTALTRARQRVFLINYLPQST
ncbi:MAG: AAA family ATPase [Muribaculaceae bacterium]|nr:AAA family ATPase [Muribaculaceae bacterium]